MSVIKRFKNPAKMEKRREAEPSGVCYRERVREGTVPVALFKLDRLVMRYFASTGGTVVTLVSRSIISIHFSTVRACDGTQGSSGIEKRPLARSIRTRRTIFVN